MSNVSVFYTEKALEAQAKVFARQLNLPLVESACCLMISREKLSLNIKGFSPVYMDFNLANWQKRHAEGKKQGLIRACKPKPGLRILDVTGGWGKDAFILACFGADVIILERNNILAALLEDALQRCETKHLHLSLLHMDAKDYLLNLEKDDYPDVIYMDPMHPKRQKSSLVKKKMQVLQQLIGFDEDALELLQIAKRRVRKRVVLKWPQKHQPLLPADASIEGKTVRFDIFLS